jgi:Transcriptional regulator, AbiEi antitoxin
VSTSAAGLLALLKKHGLRFFSTGDLASLSGLDPTAASQALHRLSAKGLVQRMKRGLWGNLLAPNLSLAEALPQLTSPWPVYVSLYSALAGAGVVAETPVILYAVSSGPPRRIRTPLGDTSIHHLPAGFIWGWKTPNAAAPTMLIAEPEKALLDLAYLSLLPSSRLGFPPLRPHRRRLDRARLKVYAARLGYAPLTDFLKKLGFL